MGEPAEAHLLDHGLKGAIIKEGFRETRNSECLENKHGLVNGIASESYTTQCPGKVTELRWERSTCPCKLFICIYSPAHQNKS